jgi:hypothetical protein
MSSCPDDTDAVVLTGTGAPGPALTGPGLVVTHRRAADREWAAVVRTPAAEAASLVARVRADGVTLQRAAHARIQRGLDLWQPATGRRRAIGIYEYVRSEPSARDEYYRSQYEVSGPAMRALWERGLVQRFVGAELVEDIVPAPPGTADWDVLHLTQFAVAALPRMLSWTALFDEHARAAGHASMAELKRAWRTQRSMTKGPGRIVPLGAGSSTV